MVMKNLLAASEIHNLFANGNPEEVWAKAVDIVRRTSLAYDFFLARTAFNDVVRLFHGEYSGYCPIRTLYHDLIHTLDVFMCAVRLMHGVHISGTRLTDNEITWIMMASLMHDIGYAQLYSEEAGTGAQYTLDHVKRGIEFMRRYIIDQHFPPDFSTPLESMIHSTDPALVFSEINFPNARTRLLAQIVSTADMVGQMADRSYLEKLLFLYLEFKEAHFGNYQNMHDLLRQTKNFYEITRKKKLDETFEGIYKNLALHFKDYLGVESNYYLESIEKNIAYLSKVISLNEAESLSMLKRGGIVEKAQAMVAPNDLV